MGSLDKRVSGVQRNSTKKDFNLYTGGGLGGGGAAPLTGVNRFTYWIDHNPFATAIRKLVAQNVSFVIYGAQDGLGGGLGGSEKPLWCRIEQSNDCPDEILTSAAEIAATRTLAFTNLQLPPYYINTNFLTNPADFNYQNDQGRYVYDAYSGNGYGMAKTGAGAFDTILQSFVPQSPQLTGVWLKDLFRVGSTSDHTLYADITVKLYDSNLNLVGTIGKLKKTYPLQYGNNPPVLNVDYNNTNYVTADDALQYWTNIDQIHFIPDMPIAVKQGATYYIGVEPASFGSSFNYAVGNNADNSGNYNAKGRYIFGQAFTGVKTAGLLTSVSPIATNMSLCFITQRNVGRTAYTFLWDNSTPSYWYDPATNLDEFKFVKEDFDQRI